MFESFERFVGAPYDVMAMQWNTGPGWASSIVLFEFDRYLIARGTDSRTKGKKIQTALKIHGFYYTKIDGAVGPGTRKAIGEYKAANGLSYGTSLDFEEEYQLISSAKEINDRNIEDSIASLKSLGAKKETPATVIPMSKVPQGQ